MWNKGTILAIATFILGNGTSAGLQITGIINPALGWTIVCVSTILSVLLFIYAFRIKAQADRLAAIKYNGLVLLRLLDEVYQRLKVITRLTIRKLRARDWRDMESASIDLMWLTDIDIESAVESILLKNVVSFTSGRPMTVVSDSKQLATKIQKSPLFTRNPEDVAKDATVILQERVPYLKRKMEHDGTVK